MLADFGHGRYGVLSGVDGLDVFLGVFRLDGVGQEREGLCRGEGEGGGVRPPLMRVS